MTAPPGAMSVSMLLSEAVHCFDDADELGGSAHLLLVPEATSEEIHTAAQLLVQSGLRRGMGVELVRQAWAETLVPGPSAVPAGSSLG